MKSNYKKDFFHSFISCQLKWLYFLYSRQVIPWCGTLMFSVLSACICRTAIALLFIVDVRNVDL